MKTFPLRTFIICLTAWAIATEILIFDQMKFNAKAELLEQTARALQRAQPTRQYEAPDQLKLERL